jgi:hypothetical protein
MAIFTAVQQISAMEESRMDGEHTGGPGNR